MRMFKPKKEQQNTTEKVLELLQPVRYKPTSVDEMAEVGYYLVVSGVNVVIGINSGQCNFQKKCKSIEYEYFINNLC